MFSNLNGMDWLFLICAGFGGVFVLMRLFMQCFGGDTDTHTDFHVGTDLHVDTDFGGDAGEIGTHLEVQHMDADVSFKLLSLHGLSAFLFMFGLVGFAFYRQSQVGAALSLIGGVMAGLASFWIIGRVFRFIGRLQSSGTLENVSAIGGTGSVYLTIPSSGTGRVMINVRNHLREFDASSHDKEEIKTGEPVKVVWIEGNTLIVKRLSNSKGDQNV